mgnify:CR=1 FL=1
MADELDDQAAMAQWASENPPGGGEGVNQFGDFSGGMGGWDDGAGDSASERILNQDEIDSLLGFDLSGDGGDDRTGIRAIINSALVSYERLPMLEIVFDRLVRLMTTSLRNFTSDNVEVSLDNISSIRFGDYLNSIPLPAILAVFRAEELDNYGLLTVDSNLIYSIVDVLLGGRRGTAAMRIEGRPYTTIERVLVQRMIEVGSSITGSPSRSARLAKRKVWWSMLVFSRIHSASNSGMRSKSCRPMTSTPRPMPSAMRSK